MQLLYEKNICKSAENFYGREYYDSGNADYGYYGMYVILCMRDCSIGCSMAGDKEHQKNKKRSGYILLVVGIVVEIVVIIVAIMKFVI